MPYVRRNWQNAPSSATPLNADALNNIEDGVEEALAKPGATDAAVEAIIADTDSDTYATLNSTIGAVATPLIGTAVTAATGGAEGPLGQIVKAKTGPFRVLLCGTSIATFDRSPVQVFVESLKSTYGDAGMYTIRGGLLGGSITAAFQGWKKQRYAGIFYQRSRGEASSTDLRFVMYGDRIEVDFSREADSESADVQIDGVTVGTSPAAGTQAFTQRQVFTTTAGAHVVTIKKPAGAGYVYFERLASYNAARTGVELVDGSQGGSTLGMMVQNVAASDGAMAATIPVVGDNGVNGWVGGLSGVDAVIVQQTVNDAGSSPLGSYFTTVYEPTMNKVVEATRAARVPLVVVVEMAGHYIMPNDGGSTGRHNQFEQIAAYLRGLKVNNHVTVFDHHAATAMDDDIPGYAARYYSTVTSLNVAAGTYSGDFIHADEGTATEIGIDLIHRQYGLTPPKVGTASKVRLERIRTLPLTDGKDQTLAIAGTTKRYPQAAGRALLITGPGDSTSFQHTYTHFYRDPSPTNIASALQDSINAAGTSDAYGAYETWNLKNFGLPGTVPWTTPGTKRLLTVRASGTIIFRAYGVAQFLTPEGVTIPRTDVTNDRTEARITVGDEPVVVSIWVAGTAASGNGIGISGKVYECIMSDTSGPVLSKDAAAGAQGPTGSTGPAGGVVSAGVVGSWSAPTVGGPLTTSAVAAGTLYLVPFIPQSNGTIDNLGIRTTVAASAGGTVRLNVYATDATSKRPLGAPLGGTDVVLDSTTTAPAALSGALGSAVALTGGTLYWLAILPLTAGCTVTTSTGVTPFVYRHDPAPTGASGYAFTGISTACPTITGGFYGSNSYATFAPMVHARLA